MEFNGIITEIKQERKITDTFSIQELMLDCSTFNTQNGDKYENHLCFQFNNNKIQLLKDSGAKVGDRVEVKFNPQGRYFDKKDNSGKGHSQNLNAFGIKILVKAAEPTEATARV